MQQIAPDMMVRKKRLLRLHASSWCHRRRKAGFPVEFNALSVYLHDNVSAESWEFLLNYAREFIALWFLLEAERPKRIRHRSRYSKREIRRVEVPHG